MSKYRYFKDARTDHVHSTRNGDDWRASDPEDVEVKVAPLDAVVIEGPLPEVRQGPWGAQVEVVPGEHFGSASVHINARTPRSPEYLRSRGLAYLALAEYVEQQHPPADEEQVQVLAEKLARDFNSQIGVPDKFGYHYGGAVKMADEFLAKARRMHDDGVRVVTPDA